MEHILSSQIMHHIESQGIICETQFSFRRKHSCETQLLLTVDDFARALDHNNQVDVGILRHLIKYPWPLNYIITVSGEMC